MDFFLLAIYLLTLFTTGFLAVSLVFKNSERDALEILSASPLVGSGIVATLFFWFSLAGVRPSPWLIATLLVSSSGAIYLLARRGGIRLNHHTANLEKREKLFFVAGAAVALFFLCVVSADALLMPLYSIDSFALWCLKAKILAYEGVYGTSFHQPSLSYSHLNYPLAVPYLISGVYVSIGRFDDALGKSIFPFFYLFGMLFMYASLRWKLNGIWALCLTLLFISQPAVIHWCAVGIADFPLTIYYAGSIFYLTRFLAEEDWRDCALSLLFTFFCVFTKNEGMAIAAINAAVLAAFHLFPRFTVRKLITPAIYAALLLILSIPWLWWRSGIPTTHVEEISSRYTQLLSPESLDRIGEILSLFARNMISIDSWGFLWLTLPAMVFLGFGTLKDKCILATWALLTAQIATYALVFMISPWSPGFLAEMALERILTHLVPAVVYLIAFNVNAGCRIPS